MTKQFIKTGEVLVHTETADAGQLDAKGRKIGYQIEVYEMLWEEHTEADCSRCFYCESAAVRFWAQTTTTRNGKVFGAYIKPIKSETLEQVLKLARARRDNSFKRLGSKAKN